MTGEKKTEAGEWVDISAVPDEVAAAPRTADLMSLDDLFAGAQGSSCSIDGTCD